MRWFAIWRISSTNGASSRITMTIGLFEIGLRELERIAKVGVIGFRDHVDAAVARRTDSLQVSAGT